MPAPIGLPPAEAVTPERERERVREAARGMEAALVRQMLSAMERAQLEEGLFGSGPGAGAWQTAFQMFLSEALSEREPFGLAEGIADELLRGREGRAGAGLPDGPAGAELMLGVADGSDGFLFFREGTQAEPKVTDKSKEKP